MIAEITLHGNPTTPSATLQSGTASERGPYSKRLGISYARWREVGVRGHWRNHGSLPGGQQVPDIR